MAWDEAVKTMKRSEDYGDVEYETKMTAVAIICNESGVDDDEWIYNGTWTGNETPESIQQEHDEIVNS